MKFNVALIILYDKEKMVLLQQRSRDARILPGHWAFFGGMIDQGEAPDEAVRREALEELSYRPKSPQLIIEQGFKEGNDRGRLFVYIENFLGDKSKLRLGEGEGWGWYGEREIGSLKMVRRDRKIAKAVFGALKG